MWLWGISEKFKVTQEMTFTIQDFMPLYEQNEVETESYTQGMTFTIQDFIPYFDHCLQLQWVHFY